MITLEVDGTEFSGFTSANVTRSMLSISGGFTISSSAQPGKPYPIKLGQKCIVKVDGNVFLTGFVDDVNPSYSGGENPNHTVTFSGRDKTQDVIDSTVGDVKEFETPITLESIIKTVTGLSVINNVSGLRQFEQSELESSEIGETQFDFIKKLANKLSVLLTTDGKGAIVITRTGTDNAPGDLVNIIGNNGNNVTSGSGTVSTRNRYGKYVARSQLNPSATIFKETPVNVSSPKGEAEDSEMIAMGRGDRVLEYYVKGSLNSEQLTDDAKWQANVRRSKSNAANLTTALHSVNGKIWQPNTRVSVKDEFLNIDQDMLIESVTFKDELSNEGGMGSITEFKIAPPDAYSINPNASVKQSSKGDVLNDFKL